MSYSTYLVLRAHYKKCALLIECSRPIVSYFITQKSKALILEHAFRTPHAFKNQPKTK
jgi:hypothetical protein